jgi:ABC-type transport system involved in cytochrome bd biosynthesis fused ATPase/permease subunit
MDKIIYMKSGKIEWVGNYQEIQNQPFYSKLLLKKDFNNNINEGNSNNNIYNKI